MRSHPNNSRYRKAVEEDKPRDREVWSSVARFWYAKAADRSPAIGRLYHHLAILAQPYTLEQLSLYTKSLTCVTPFEHARDSLMTLSRPISENREGDHHISSSLESLAIKAHGLIFLAPNPSIKQSNDVLNSFKYSENRTLVGDNVRRGRSFINYATGAVSAITQLTALFEFGALIPTNRSAHRVRFQRAMETVSGQLIARSTSIRTSKDVTRQTDPRQRLLVMRDGDCYVQQSQLLCPGSKATSIPGHPASREKLVPKQKSVWTLFLKAVSHNILPPKLFYQLLLTTSFSRRVFAYPLPTNGASIGEEGESFGWIASAADAAVLLLILAGPGAAQILVRFKRMNAIPVWAVLMAIYAFGWWCIHNDATVSLGLSVG